LTGVSGRTRSTTSCTTPNKPKLERSTRIRSRSRSVTVICLPCGVINLISVTQDDSCAMPAPKEACGKVVTATAPREIWPISGVSGSSKPRSASARTSVPTRTPACARTKVSPNSMILSSAPVSTVVPPSPPTQRVCE
jgi:hypothetical protein